jgi:hypothetical protein
LTTRTILGKEYRSFSSSFCNFLYSPVTSSLLGPYPPQHPILKTPSAYVSSSMSVTKFHTHQFFYVNGKCFQINTEHTKTVWAERTVVKMFNLLVHPVISRL